MMIGCVPLWRSIRLARFVLPVIAVLLTVLVAVSARAAAPADGDVEALLRAFSDGMTPEQLDAVVTVMDEGEVRAALRARLLADLEARRGAATAPPEGTLELYVHKLDRVGRGVVVKVEGSAGPHAEVLGAAATEAVGPVEAAAT
jgi:hypothetical protein